MHASGFAWNLFGCPFRSLVSDFSSTIVTNSTTGHLQIKCPITLQEFYTCIILDLGSSRSDAFNINYSGSNFSAYSPSTQNTTPYHFVCSSLAGRARTITSLHIEQAFLQCTPEYNITISLVLSSTPRCRFRRPRKTQEPCPVYLGPIPLKFWDVFILNKVFTRNPHCQIW